MSRFKKDFDWQQINLDHEAEEEIVLVSRSELRRDNEQLLDMVQWIINLSPAQYNKLELDSSLDLEFDKARKLGFSPRKRQAMNIAKKMRNLYPRIEDMEWLKQAINRIERPHQQSNLQFNPQEIARNWQQKLLQGRINPQQLAMQYPELEEQQLTDLIILSNSSNKNQAKQGKQQLINYLQQAFTLILQRINH